MNSKPNKVVLAYSGGLDTSVMLKWIKEKYNCPVIAYAANVGQGDEELKGLEEKALETGAEECYILDLQKEFAEDFIFPMLRAGAIYENSYLLGTSIARPIIAKGQVESAKKTGSDTVAHGATGKGNDQIRFELTYAAFNPLLKVLSPWREWDFGGRTELINFAKQHKIPIPVSNEKPFSTDRNLFHISFEGGILEDPWTEPPENMYRLTKSAEETPDAPTYVEITYKEGNPVQINGQKMSPLELLTNLNKIAGENGIGRVDIVENRFIGMKSRGVYETPGGTVLHEAKKAVESLTLDKEVIHLKNTLMPEYSKLVYNGFWYSPEREFLQASIDSSMLSVCGTARVKLFKGSCRAVGRKAPPDYNLYREDLATFEKDSVYSQKDAEGFINLNALRIKTSSDLKNKKNR